MYKIALIIILPILLVSACTYELENENIVELSKEPQALVTKIDLLNVSDTFPLFARSTLFSYQVGLEKVDSLRVNVYVNNRWRYSSSMSRAEFTLKASDYEEGYHNLRLDVVTNSGTGSLGDKLGNELLLWQREWVFSLELQPAKPLEILDVYPKDGHLAIEWEKSNALTEKKITLRSGSWGSEWSYIISDPTQTHLLDSKYVGGEVKVMLENISLNPEDYSPVTSMTASFSPPKVSDFSTDEYGNVKISWNKPVFYKSVGQYRIYVDDELKETISEINDTTAVLDTLSFITVKRLKLTTVSKHQTKEEWGEEIKAYSTSGIRVGEVHPWYMDNLIHAPKRPEYGFQMNHEAMSVLYKDSVAVDITGMEIDSYFNLAISSDGSALYISQNNQIGKVNRTGEVEIVLGAGEIDGEEFTPRLFSIGNDRYLCFANKNGPSSIFSPGYPASWVYVYDLVKKEITSRIAVPEDAGRVISTHQSVDGKYLAIQYPYQVDIHTLSEGKVVHTMSREYTNSLFFSAKEDHHLILYTFTAIEVLDLAAGSSVKHSLETSYILDNLNYDPVTGYIGGHIKDYYYIIDPASGTVVRKIRASSGSYVYNFYDGSIYVYKRKLDLKLK